MLFLPFLKSEDVAIRKAAFASLKQMSEGDNLPNLFSLLNESTQPKEIEELQKAIIAAIGSSANKATTNSFVLQQVAQANPDKKAFIF